MESYKVEINKSRTFYTHKCFQSIPCLSSSEKCRDVFKGIKGGGKETLSTRNLKDGLKSTKGCKNSVNISQQWIFSFMFIITFFLSVPRSTSIGYSWKLSHLPNLFAGKIFQNVSVLWKNGKLSFFGVRFT